MNKKERYLKFIVEELKNKIEIDFDDATIDKPFFYAIRWGLGEINSDNDFFNYVNTYYGISEEDFEYVYGEIIDFVIEEIEFNQRLRMDDFNEEWLDESEDKSLIKESGFARVNRILQGDIDNINTYGIITAQNPCGCELTPKENRKLQKELEAVLGISKLGFHKIGGNFFHIEEDSVLIPNIKREDILKLGVAFKQYSVIYGFKDVRPNGKIYINHYMLRTYCDGFCRKTDDWDQLTLNQKLRKLKPLDKDLVGHIESESSEVLSSTGLGELETNYSYVGGKDRRFKIPFNESEIKSNKLEKYLQFVINDLVNDTKIDYDKRLFSLPFYSNTRTHFSMLRNELNFADPNFNYYCRNRYGLSKDEIDYVWRNYRSIIENKII